MAVAEAKGIQSDLIPKIATGFCSGIARTSGQCGALSGAIMGISLMTGRSDPDESVEENYRLVQKLMTMFEGEFGSGNCGNLTQVDLNSEEGQAAFKASNQIENCYNYVEFVTEMTLSLLENE
ncbi:MAG: C_GCAxxG_C_C family protein [Anaerolineales bacterium]|nr:C_GCAxxG_C_C family protein [Chloroflexota bacterium]MBL6981284.1 C_GCAxxG_C_C family protein [Anaerolineales bacterium]